MDSTWVSGTQDAGSIPAATANSIPLIINRAFVYGDLLFETMKWQSGNVPFFEHHLQRLKQSLKLLKMNDNIDYDALRQQIKSKAESYTNARVRVVVYRDADGFYLPHQHNTQFAVEVFALTPSPPQLNVAGVYTAHYKPCHTLSNLKSGNALVYVLAALHANEQQWDDAIILNEHGRVCESTASNIFIQSAGKIVTPPLSEGCVDGVMRNICLQDVSYGLQGAMQLPITLDMLAGAQKIWLTNALWGVRVLKQVLLS
jgi:branched-chain amino acid aminotransferase